MIVNRSNASHYVWGENCDGWILSPDDQLLVIEERMPPGSAEIRHHHARARQFFYVLAGEFCLAIDGATFTLRAGEGMAVPPGTWHQARNDSAMDAHFLVVSSPTTRGDRVDQG